MRRFLATLLLLAPACAFAQRYNFKVYGEEEGLQNLVVQVILQDRAGFLWVGTQNGVYRYDGSRFAGFGKSEGLPGARIEALHESVDGTLWIGTRVGLARRAGDRFETIPMMPAISANGVAQPVAQGVVSRAGIASDAAGKIYLATERGLVIATRAGDRYSFSLIASPHGSQPEEAASVYVDATGHVWYGCGASLCRLENGVAHDVGAESGLPAEPWSAIIGDLDGNLWVRSDHQLFVRRDGSNRFQARPGLPQSTNTYPTLALDPMGRLLVPTFKGLARESGDGWEIIDARQGLPSNDIAAVMQDREGSIWIGLLGSGLARWLGYNEWQSWSDHEGLSRESVWSLARDASGTLWVGTQFGLNYAQEREGRYDWKQLAVPGIEMVRGLAVAGNTLWIGASPGGLRAVNLATKQIRTIGAAQGFTSPNVRHIMADREGRVWVSTRDGLFRTSPGSDKFEAVVIPSPVGGAAEVVHMTMMDANGQVWAAGSRGLARFAAGKWTRFTEKDGLKSNVVAHIAEDPDGSLWIGYYDAFGLSRISFQQGQLKLEHFTTGSGLRSDKSIFLGFDGRGWLWAGSDHGVDVFDRVRWRHYGKSAGLIWDDCNTNAFLADQGGAVWIGTSRGLSRFRPLATPPPTVPPPVVFTAVKFGDEPVEASSPIEVPYRRHSLQVRFAALSFVQESSVLFRYRLASVDRHWLETQQRELNYPQLPPGDYTLEVTARTAQGVWSAEPERLQFRVLPPWYLTWWFRIGCTLAVILIGRLMWQRRTYRLEAERHHLETAVADRTRELSLEKQRLVEEQSRTENQKLEIERLLREAQAASKSKSEFLANMSHEIRTPMNGVIGMTDLVLATPLTSEQREYLATARLSANSLLTILNDVLDFSKIEAGRLDLNPISFSVRHCVREIGRMFAITASEKKLTFEIQIEEEVPDHVVGDPDRLRQVLLNLAGNAVKFTSEGGVWVKVGVECITSGAVELRFAVRDTGIGIPPEKLDVIFEAFRQADGSTTRKYGGTGLGLAICSRLVEMMGGSIRVKSEMGQGSTFYFTARFGVSTAAENSAPPDPLSLQKMLSNVAEPNGNGTLSAALQPPRNSLHVLLAEDNPVNQRVAARLLEKRGHRVALAGTGREALEWLSREKFDLILMDVQMPELDGLEATAIIRARENRDGGHIPIIALTAHAMKGDRERCLEAGMDNYVNKPIEAVSFLEIVESTVVESATKT